MSTIVLTGATSGIGFATAKGILNYATSLLLIGRLSEKATSAITQLKSISTACNIQYYEADLSDQVEIRQVAKAILKDHSVIDVLINNAGIWYSDRHLVSPGLEMCFAVNYLAPFLLTHLLYPAILRSPEGRIVNVTSGTHRRGRIHFQDLTLSDHYTGMRSYAQSKLALVLFSYEFHRRNPHQNISINSLEPGMVNTQIGQKHAHWLHRLIWRTLRLGSVSLEKGAETSIFLATSSEIQGVSGRYWANCKAIKSSVESYKESSAAQLWEVSMSLCGIQSYFQSMNDT
jgi:NAD(P)-dependent dehydrogenase (short-subunit alcohol dehydrogenase family)